MNEKEFIEQFTAPASAYRAKPFWAWNGRLEKKELIRQIHIMKEMGFGGYFMHSRTGLQTEYMGEEWFGLINACADEGQSEGMESWLYDEDRWPSGIAGGLATKNEKYRAKFLEMTSILPGQPQKIPTGTIAVFACQMDGNQFKKLRRIEKLEGIECAGGIENKEYVKCSEDETLLVFSIAPSECKDVYNGYTYLDTMNKEAVWEFLRLTHVQYKEKCKGRLGTSIKGIFTDEPHRGAMFSSFSEGRINRVPYTDYLFAAFQEEAGYDLIDKLPFLFLRREGEAFSKTALDYVNICQNLFLKNFAQPIQQWCRDNHMIFTGHVLHEDSLSAQTVMQGSLMRFYEYMDYPGIDILTESNTCWWVAKQAVSVARQLDKPFVLSELYGGTGWQMSLEEYKQVGDWQALFGINLRCPHLSWYTMRGEAKRDYPASIFYQSAWYKEYEKLETYFARLGVFLSQGEVECELLVLNPIESVWGYCRSGAFNGLDAADDRIQFLEKRYRETFDFLVRAHIDFDYGDEKLLESHGEVENGTLWLGSCSYKKVLVSGMDTIRKSTLKILAEFRRQGGTVIFAGELPQYVDGVTSCENTREMTWGIEKLARLCIKTEFVKDDIAALCSSGKEVQITGKGSEYILCRSCICNQIRYVMLLNSDRENAYYDITLNLGKGKYLELWDARTGKIIPQEVDENERCIVTVEFSRGEERLYRICNKKQEDDTPQIEKAGWREQVTDSFSYTLDEDNIMVLDQVTVEIEDKSICGEVLKADWELRACFDIPMRSGEMIQPWYEEKYNKEQFLKAWAILLKYQFSVKEIPSKVRLAVEDIQHIEALWVNGNAIELKAKGHWIDRCFTCIEISGGFLQEGQNEITMKYHYQSTAGLEAVYLLGEFGVYQNNSEGKWEISRLPEKLKAGDICKQGLPFYSGKVRYHLPKPDIGGELKTDRTPDIELDVKLNKKSARRYTIKNLQFSGSCIKVVGDTEQLLFAPPYTCEVNNPKALEVVLTRRNTFGPLHCRERRRFAYGPEAFLTVGEEWQDDYTLLEQGLLKSPELIHIG